MIRDISMELFEHMIHWPGSATPVQLWETRLDRNEESNASRWALGSHSGTHVEAPLHFLEDGPALDGFDLSIFMGLAHVVETGEGCSTITRREVDAIDIGEPLGRILFKTSNSVRRVRDASFDSSYVGIALSAAEALVERGATLVGIDYLAIEPFGTPDFPTHRKLLSAGVLILEGLVLTDVVPGPYTLTCLPLKLRGSEAAPVRAVLTDPM